MTQTEEFLSAVRYARNIYAQGARERWIERLKLPSDEIG